jgi:hypothetical protein
VTPTRILAASIAGREVVPPEENARGLTPPSRARCLRREGKSPRVAYETLVESTHPLVVQRVRELAMDWGNDPQLIRLFGTVVYRRT